MTQTQKIRAHLEQYRSITPIEALNKYGVFRLAARVKDLRESGFPVQTVSIHRDGKHYAEYVI